ncbi:MAG TPA: hypothetical protein VES67_16030 [Vicinamibacterales bacterium]|nr:hypothetical protein [Vicinamibacterales bacterium]
MTRTSPIRTSLLPRLIGTGAALVIAMAPIGAQTGERYIANAVSLATPGPTGAAIVEINVTRWSPEAERDRLIKTLVEKGPEQMLETLRDLPRAGFIRTPGNLGYDLRFARKQPLEEGGEQIVIATDRPIGLWEAANRPRTIDYPFTLIELRLDNKGNGEGKISLATKIVYDKRRNTIVLENYSSAPVMLTKVRRESGAEPVRLVRQVR